jgi:hypothetical protein
LAGGVKAIANLAIVVLVFLPLWRPWFCWFAAGRVWRDCAGVGAKAMLSPCNSSHGSTFSWC